MWDIKSITAANGEPVGGVWGGSGSNIGQQQLGTPLADESAGYVVSCGDIGSLTLVPTGTTNGMTNLTINGSVQLQVVGDVLISVLDDNTVEITNGGWQRYPLLSQASDVGPIVQLVMFLVSGAQPLWEAWDTDPLQVLSQAGLPDSAMDNLGDSVSGAPSGQDQFTAWLKTVQFSRASSLSDEAWASWLSCTLCKCLVAGGAAATFVLVAAACIATGPAGLAAAAAGIAQFDAIIAIATATSLSVPTVAQAAAAAFFSAGAAAFVGAVLDAICQATGACSDSGFVAPSGLPVRHPLRPAM
ncbi:MULTISPECIES: hypothetical protein [unclassified Streptomyces]|uniref:hypothetical protein n=1 Tax=unclassified Streptomyces TaxID=2593676 RepID=UPI00336ACA5B